MKEIVKDLYINIKNFLKYFISPVAILMWVIIQGIIIILYEIYCPNNYYYYPMFDELLNLLLLFITVVFF